MEAVAICSQTMQNTGVFQVNVMAGPPQIRHAGLTYSIGQEQLFMSFGLVEDSPLLEMTVFFFFKDREFQFEGVDSHLSPEGIAYTYLSRYGPYGPRFSTY